MLVAIGLVGEVGSTMCQVGGGVIYGVWTHKDMRLSWQSWLTDMNLSSTLARAQQFNSSNIAGSPLNNTLCLHRKGHAQICIGCWKNGHSWIFYWFGITKNGLGDAFRKNWPLAFKFYFCDPTSKHNFIEGKLYFTGKGTSCGASVWKFSQRNINLA